MSTITYKELKPDRDITALVERFWVLENLSDEEKELMVIPDGRVDIFYFCSASQPVQVVLMGLEAQPAKRIFRAKTKIFAISLNLLAVEYLLKQRISGFVNNAKPLPNGFWGIIEGDLENFDTFCTKATAAIKDRINFKVDDRKRKLFELIYSSCGAYSVADLSKSVFWTSRQINRYFNQQFGIPLKTYCNILRFKASLYRLKDGQIYPEGDFVDQAHFIRNVRKFSGVVPTELSKNKNDRFVQLSVLSKQ